MSMVDVSRALTNPRTLDCLTVHRRKQCANEYGEGREDVQILKNVYGVVTVGGGNELDRKPDAETNKKTLTVITRFPLRGESKASVDGKEYLPDVILWRGDKFLVVDVEDYSNHAHGFVKVTAASFDIVDQPPTPRDTGGRTESSVPAAGYGEEPYGGGGYNE